MSGSLIDVRLKALSGFPRGFRPATSPKARRLVPSASASRLGVMIEFIHRLTEVQPFAVITTTTMASADFSTFHRIASLQH